MKRLLVVLILLCASTLAAAQQNHGITVTAISDTSAAACTSATIAANGYTCTFIYQAFEGASPGNEIMAAPFGSFAAAPWSDNGPAMNSYLGTTRCYVFQFQEVLTYPSGPLTLNSGNSAEWCFSFPAPPSAPSLTITPH
jgi:hypothetical protein